MEEGNGVGGGGGEGRTQNCLPQWEYAAGWGLAFGDKRVANPPSSGAMSDAQATCLPYFQSSLQRHRTLRA